MSQSTNKTSETISAYSFSTFGRTHTATQEMKNLMDDPDASIEQMREKWDALYPLLQKQLLVHSEENEVKSFMNDFYTGMTPASINQLPEECTQTWDRLRVLQGLAMHLQMWVWVCSHFVLKYPNSHNMFDWNARHLIGEIYTALQANDSIEELEDWVDKVICKALEDGQEESQKTKPVGILEGWQLVPSECTEEMADAWNKNGPTLEDGYRAMLEAAPAPTTTIAAVPAGWKVVPSMATSEIVFAIECQIDSQLVASAIDPSKMFRQDGQYVWEAAIAAATSQEGQAQ